MYIHIYIYTYIHIYIYTYIHIYIYIYTYIHIHIHIHKHIHILIYTYITYHMQHWLIREVYKFLVSSGIIFFPITVSFKFCLRDQIGCGMNHQGFHWMKSWSIGLIKAIHGVESLNRIPRIGLSELKSLLESVSIQTKATKNSHPTYPGLPDSLWICRGASFFRSPGVRLTMIHQAERSWITGMIFGAPTCWKWFFFDAPQIIISFRFF